MFFREKRVKQTRLVQLVESHRDTEGRPRQRIVASLGDASLPEGSARRIARCVQRRLEGQRELFVEQLGAGEAEWVDRIVKLADRTRSSQRERGSEALDGVVAEEIETVNVVEFGPGLAGMAAWNALGLSRKLAELGMNKRAVSIAQAMVINRLVEPLSEWALIDWLERTGLPECLNVRVTKSTKDRLYKTSDELLKHRKELEKYLRREEAELFGLHGSIVLYDVTNTHFEGVCAANPKAVRGKNKQKRNDCPQVAVGMAFNEHGLALAHEVFEGNISDANTLLQILERLGRAGEGSGKPVVILDAGIATEANLALLREKGYAYLVNVTRGSRTKYIEQFRADDFVPLPGRDEDQQVEVKSIAHPEAEGDRLVLCRSGKRRDKEQAMLSNAEKRFLAEAGKLRQRVTLGRLRDKDKILKAIGRVLAKHPRVARFYQLDFAGADMTVQRKASAIDEAYELCGDYVLRTDQAFPADVLWNLYMTLLKAEEGFKMLKGTLGLRPNFHQKEHRVDGHIFISVLAYHLLCWINQKIEAAGDNRTWRTLRRLLRTHCLLTTRLPLEDGRIISIRKASVPDEEQARIYQMLGINWRAAYKPRRTQIKG
ncbi:MAG: IS1634 family transposase [Kiritimatiellae bacterium]|nr:IS1634 family transposase [Kiritimatiellia bacterium]